MRVSFAIFVSLAVIASEVSASMMSPAHARIARRMNRKKRCISRNTNANRLSNGSSSSSSASSANTTPAPQPQPHAPSPQHGTINVHSECGDIGASTNSDRFTGPNGSSRWLTCGIEEGGWRPPNIRVENLIFQDLGQVLSRPGNPFAQCGPYLEAFNRYGAELGIPAILIASIAMQESSCRADVVGGGGEQGLMQITPDKCGGAPNGDCRNPEFNISVGARYLRSRLDATGGNILKAVGEYNGWRDGMTVGSATNARYTDCCKCQNNLDYPHNLFNGWLQGVYPDSWGQPIWNNLSVCG